MTDNTNETIGESNHGWLEQFEALTKESFLELENVVKMGLEPAEGEFLILASVKLLQIACVHDPDAVDKVLNLLHQPKT